jgi:hypothetical protein
MLQASPTAMAPRQLNILFEGLEVEAMSPDHRANAINQLAILLLQAAGVQLQEANNDNKH